MGKRGRKPNKENKNYFAEEQEMAVVDYLNAETMYEKDLIYRTKLKFAFEKMIESIIRRYKLFVPNEEYADTFNDTLSFLLTKADKYNPESGYKAYSYYGNVCKNYLIGKINSYTKSVKRNPSYELMESEFSNSLSYSSDIDDAIKLPAKIVEMLIEKINDMVCDPEYYNLKEDEVVLGKALQNLLENWDFVLSTDKSNKLNKNAILLFLRDSTGFSTKAIRTNLKKYKMAFLDIKNDLTD